MFPGVDGFGWDAGHVVFLGLFFSVVFVIAATVLTAARRALRDYGTAKVSATQWRGDFAELLPPARRCRHEFTGEFSQRVCQQGFECGGCSEHARLSAVSGERLDEHVHAGDLVAGFFMPADRLYHRGHTWVRSEDDGTVTVGLDDFAARLTGEPERIELPTPGTTLEANGTAWRMTKDGIALRILSPVRGTVVATGSKEQGWFLRLSPIGKGFDFRHLLRGREIRPWLTREMERLARAFSRDGAGLQLADGGTPVSDFTKAYPDADWDDVWGEMFLEP